jgi:hypothetical protein
MSRSPWTARLAVLLLTLTTIVTGAPPAQAVVPDAAGWVLWNQPAALVTGFGTWPPATTVTPLTPGRYQVVFPGQGAPGGVVHVTAISQSPAWCLAENWFPSGSNEIVIIRCHLPGGAPAPTSFSAFFTRSSGGPSFGPYGYADSQPNGALVSQFNSTGAGNASTPVGAGQWDVVFPNLGTVTGALGGGVQVTAVSPNAAVRCKAGFWNSLATSLRVRVLCFTAAGSPANVRFTVTFQETVSLYGASGPPNNHGYLLSPSTSSALQTNFNSAGGFGVNSSTVVSTPTQTYVVFPNIAAAPNTVQVTAHGINPNYCNINNFWVNANPAGVLVRDVVCYTPASVVVSDNFSISMSSRL